MHEIINYLKDAVTRGQHSGLDGCYVIRDGVIYARNMFMTAGIDWSSDAAFTISADALDAALARMKGEVDLTINADDIVVKCGRLKSTIRRVSEATIPIPSFPEEWSAGPAGLTAALAAAKPFMGDRSWQVGMRLYNDRVTAFSPHGGVDVEVPGLGLDEPCLIAESVITFLIAQGDPDEIGTEQGAIWFRWDDGRWVRAALINDVMPEGIIARIFDKAGEEASVKVLEEWEDALGDAEALTDATVRLTIEGLQATKANITTDIDLDIDVPSDHCSYWKVEHLRAMLAVATEWNPLAYPEPALFRGERVRGVLAGFKA